MTAEGDEQTLGRQQRRHVGQRHQQRLGRLGLALELLVAQAERQRHHLVGDDVDGARCGVGVQIEARSVPPRQHVALDVLPLLVDVHPPERRGTEAEDAVDGTVVEQRALHVRIGGRVELLEGATGAEQELDQRLQRRPEAPGAVRPGAVDARDLVERHHRLHDQEEARPPQPDVVGGHQVDERLDELVRGVADAPTLEPRLDVAGEGVEDRQDVGDDGRVGLGGGVDRVAIVLDRVELCRREHERADRRVGVAAEVAEHRFQSTLLAEHVGDELADRDDLGDDLLQERLVSHRAPPGWVGGVRSRGCADVPADPARCAGRARRPAP